MQKSENCEPEKVVMNEKKALWMRILINNIKALGIFLVLGFVTMFISGFIALFIHAGIFEPPLYWLLFFILIGLFWVHFFAGKRFLASTKNLLLDSASFIFIIVLTALVLLNAFPLTTVDSFTNVIVFIVTGPASIVRLLMLYIGVNLEQRVVYYILSLFTIFLPILMQFLGMRKGLQRKSRDSA